MNGGGLLMSKYEVEELAGPTGLPPKSVTHVQSPVLSSKKQDWQTPPWLVEVIRRALGGVIGLDPCTVITNPTGADYWYTPEIDGLVEPWRYNRVFMNPPYGRAIAAWATRFADQANRAAAIALVPPSTETEWWQAITKPTHAWVHVAFLRGRVQFVDPATGEVVTGNTTRSSLVCYNLSEDGLQALSMYADIYERTAL